MPLLYKRPASSWRGNKIAQRVASCEFNDARLQPLASQSNFRRLLNANQEWDPG